MIIVIGDYTTQYIGDFILQLKHCSIGRDPADPAVMVDSFHNKPSSHQTWRKMDHRNRLCFYETNLIYRGFSTAVVDYQRYPMVYLLGIEHAVDGSFHSPMMYPQVICPTVCY